jgi:hypothetical protein
MNDESACKLYHNTLELANQKTPHFLYQLLLESVKNHLNSPSY